MKKNYTIFVLIMLLSLLLSACGSSSDSSSEKVEPYKLEAVDGSDLNQVILTERAAERLQIATEEIQEERIDGNLAKVIPYSAIIYDLTGATWVYVSVEPLTFVREPVVVTSVDENKAVLSEGPEIGTSVATVGVAELYGADTGVGK